MTREKWRFQKFFTDRYRRGGTRSRGRDSRTHGGVRPRIDRAQFLIGGRLELDLANHPLIAAQHAAIHITLSTFAGLSYIHAARRLSISRSDVGTSARG